MKISYVLPVPFYPRFMKRINNMNVYFKESVILSFERKHYKRVELDYRQINLGKVEHGNYLKRVIPLLFALKKIRKEQRDSSVIYTFGIDTLLITLLSILFKSNKPKIVYEIGDIRKILIGNSLKSKCFRKLEEIMLRRVDLLVVTSQAFIDNYYKQLLSRTNNEYLVIENKPDLKGERQLPKESNLNKKSKITIGYFGVIRCERSLKILKRLVEESNNKFEVVIKGKFLGTEHIKDEICKTPGVKYEGEYTVPDDLPDMYLNVDIVWACYPFSDIKTGNWKWARTNRFYESCYFKKPMIVQKETEDSIIVNKYMLGQIIDMSNEDEVVATLLNLNKDQLINWMGNYSMLPRNVYMPTDEYERLIKQIT